MNIKTIKMSMTGLLLCLSSIANANVIYEFVCEPSECKNDTYHIGTFTFSDSILGDGNAEGDEILGFEFTSSAGGGVNFGTDMLLGNQLKVLFSDDNNVITEISSVVDGFTSTEAYFLDSNDNNNGLGITGGVIELDMTGVITGLPRVFFEVSGGWVRKDTVEVSVPSSLTIFSLGLIGLAAYRIKKQS